MSSGGAKTAGGFDVLAALPPLRWLALQRWFPLGLAVVMLLFLVSLLGVGIAGTPVGNRNALVVFVWILWWFLLIALLLPLASRAWCAACPIPFFGDWLQRRTLLGVRVRGAADAGGPGVVIGHNRYFGFARRWPQALSNLWPQSAGFLLLATFSAVLLTNPLATALTLGGMVIAATGIAVVFRQRTFCRFLCPVGGFLSLYSMPAPVAVRARDRTVCTNCRQKACLAGNERGWGCPWLEYPSRLERNNACGLCLECLKTCPHDNMSLFLRPPFSERRLEGYDEVWKAYLMLALALAYSAVYLGPWGALKDAANIAESGNWSAFLTYAGALWGVALGAVPGAFLSAAWLGRHLASGGVSTKSVALAGASALVPFGLFAWIAFSVPLLLANGSYVVAAASDPLGRGWDLFGTAEQPWTPVLPHWTPWLQAGLVLAGQATGLRSGWLETSAVYGRERRALLAFTPTAVLVTIAALILLRLYAG
jgi:polyferredoxin